MKRSKDRKAKATPVELTENELGDVAGGGLWMKDYGQLSCTATRLGAAGFTDNESEIGGGLYLSNSSNGTVDAVGCDWGSDADGDDNADYDIQQAPRTTSYCYGNAASLTETVSCSGGSCTTSTDSTCP